MTLPPSTPPHDPNWRKEPSYLKPHHFDFILGIVAVIISVVIGRSLFPGDASYWTNVYMTLVGVLITVFILDRRAERRDRLREERELKAQLVRDAGSPFNGVAKNAIHQLRKRGWLEGDGSLLVGANLEGANLEYTDLDRANLQGANLMRAKFKESSLLAANLQGADLESASVEADLVEANLQGANLMRADLEGVLLWAANLQGANLWGAKLQYADLKYTNLKGANLEHAMMENTWLGRYEDNTAALFDETTRLPDGTYWTPETDMTKFTNPKQNDQD